MLGLRFCARAFSSCGKWGPLFIAARGPLTIAASLVAEQRLQTLRLSSCRSRAQLLRGMWDLPRPGLEPVSPALAGRFSTTAPPGKPHESFDSCYFTSVMLEAACGKEKSQEVLSCVPSWEQFRECSRKIGKGDSIKLNTPLHICLPSPPFIPIVVHSYLANTVIPSLLKWNIGREMDHCYCERIKKIRLQKFNLHYFSY